MTGIPISSAPAARSWLFDQLTASLVPDPVSPSSMLLVCYGEPGPNEPDDIVSVGAVARDISVSALVGGGGAGWLDESYTITVDVEVYRGGDSHQTAFDRASYLIDGIVNTVRADLSMGGAVLIAKPVASACDTTWAENGEGALATGSVTIACTQRI